jgi:hypothetical protein
VRATYTATAHGSWTAALRRCRTEAAATPARARSSPCARAERSNWQAYRQAPTYWHAGTHLLAYRQAPTYWHTDRHPPTGIQAGTHLLAYRQAPTYWHTGRHPPTGMQAQQERACERANAPGTAGAWWSYHSAIAAASADGSAVSQCVDGQRGCCRAP